MTSTTSTGHRKLDAYIDGELSPLEAAEVVAAIARDPELAREAATLQHLRDTLRAAAPERPQGLELATRRRGRLALAASLALLLAASAVVLGQGFLPFGSQGGSLLGAPGDGSAAATALSLHQSWIAASEPETPPQAELLLASVQGLGQPVWIPDLSDARLTLVHARLLEAPHERLLHIGYRGTRGCHLSLFAYTPDRSAPPPARDGLRVASWTVGPLSYLMLAGGMEESHFALVARHVERATRLQVPFDGSTRLALAGSRAASAPCRA